MRETQNTLAHRVIPCLDVSNGRVVKGIKFQNIKDAGCPRELAKRYEEQEADELVFLDISATDEGRKTHIHTIELVRKELSIPLTTGGGISKLDDAGRLLDAGADKVSVNTAAVQNPSLIAEIAKKFGVQCTVLAVDAARKNDTEWEVVTHAGKKRTGMSVIDWIVRAQELGAGEVLLTSWDQDGTKSGYDLALLSAVSRVCTIPVIASGGAHTAQHLYQAIQAGADAVLAASIFHEEQTTVRTIKEELHELGLHVRL